MASAVTEPTAMSQCGRRHVVGAKAAIIVPLLGDPSRWYLASRVPRSPSRKSLSWNVVVRRPCRRSDMGGARPRRAAGRSRLGYDTGTSAEAIMTNDLLESVKDGVAVLTLNRPDRLNAMSGPMLDALLEALPRLAADASVGVVVLTGAGRGFCAGGDVKAMAEGREFAETGLEEKAYGLRSKMEVSRLLHEMPKPTIAMVRGAAAGADRKSTRLNSSHGYISYAVFCLKKKKKAAEPCPLTFPSTHPLGLTARHPRYCPDPRSGSSLRSLNEQQDTHPSPSTPSPIAIHT